MKFNQNFIRILTVALVFSSMCLIIKYSNWETFVGVLFFGWAMNLENNILNKKNDRRD